MKSTSREFVWLIAAGLLIFGYPARLGAAVVQTIDDKMYHLGTDGFPEWEELAGTKPHGRELTLKFQSKPNVGESTLLLTQKGVKQGWQVNLNRKRIGSLLRIESPLEHAISIPKGALREGENELAIRAPKTVDDIEVGKFAIINQSLAKALNESFIEVDVTDSGTGKGLPCRIIVADETGVLANLHVANATGTNITHAARSGTVYTRDGKAKIGLRPRTYMVYASRGFEYSIASKKIVLGAGQTDVVKLQIAREVQTPGWVSMDSHIHTLTHSGHGDSSVQERMLTIAGEGIEVAIATDHNHHTDYSATAKQLQVANHFTSVIGNEVTTKVGHFNAFPIAANAKISDYKLTNWPSLLKSMRDTPGVQVIQLNHPHNLHSGFSPFAAENFNPVTGENRHGVNYTFDAIEVITSAAMQSDIMLLFHDWFALLNSGLRVTGLGSSDTHDVSRYLVGQARTYVEADDSDPAAIDVNEACKSIAKGRALISFGLLTRIKINRQFQSGDLALHGNRPMNVNVKVLGPSWVSADKVELFANGWKIAERAISPRASVTKADLNFAVGPFSHDVHLIAIASGPGPSEPYWETPRPYQPKSKQFTPRIVGATNPVWIDADEDGRYTSPREYAEILFKKTGPIPTRLMGALATYDSAVAAHGAKLLHRAGVTMESTAVLRAFPHASKSVQRGFVAYRASLSGK